MEQMTLKRLAWRYGCAPKGSSEEARALKALRAADREDAGERVDMRLAGDRLMGQVDARGAKLSRAQVAQVLHALADHTAIMAALEHRPEEGSPWPAAISLGRWYHDVAWQLEGEGLGRSG